ncbi:MAG: class I SAM-dependent methyltransferase [Nanoarchaeota archaeon]|nr:class I SAM-dependent methyltransferase [Nanoarchaeota archaeon]
MKKDSKNILKETWESQYSENQDTAIKDKPFFELEIKTIKKEVEKISKEKDNLSILELGCGTGFLASELIKDSLKDRKYTYTGVDLSKNAIEISKSRKIPKTFFLEIDFFNFFEKSTKKFDLIISQRSIMALLKKEEQIKLLKLISSRLTNKGIGLFTECLYGASQKINEYRKQLGIKPFEKVWHSRYLKTEEIKKIFPKFEITDFCSTYWLITRIIYPYFEEPKHNTKLAQVASKFPESGNYGLVKLIIVKK